MRYKVKITLTEPMLGTVPLNKDLYRDYIQEKARVHQPPVDEVLLESELETVTELEEKGTTGFHRVDGEPIIYDYMVKGFFKDTCSMLRRVDGTSSKRITAFRKIIDGLVFVYPRMIAIDVAGEVTIMERPLRASTPQGERVALARSEAIPAGSTMEIEIETLGDDVSEAVLREWLDYGNKRGLGQWRNASWGRFTYEMEVVQ